MNDARARAPLLSFARYIVKQQLMAKGIDLTKVENRDITLASFALVNAYLGITDWKPQHSNLTPEKSP